MGYFSFSSRLVLAMLAASAWLFIACGGGSNHGGSGSDGAEQRSVQDNDRPIRIATAASVQLPMETLTTAFSEQTGIPCEIITGSSGQLSAQIKAGASFDIFVAANMEYPDELFRNGYSERAPETYAFGQLVLWCTAENLRSSMALLDSAAIRHIAVANPETAPFGVAAMETLKHYGLLEKVEDKLVYGQNVMQTSQFIYSGAAGMGFTSLSVVKSPQMSGKGNWIAVDTAAYRPIAQGMILLNKPGNSHREAQRFYDFMFSETAGAIMDTFGYILPPNND